MLHPDTELRHVNDVIGYGVFATHDIPRGTITWVRDRFDQTFTPAQVSSFGEMHRRVIAKYGYQDGHGDTVLCWDHGRYLNHSCAASCLSPGFEFEIAVHDIPAGAELTDDYGALRIEEPFDCHCGARDCRRIVGPNDPERMAPLWDAAVARAFPLISIHPQPLWELVKEKDLVAAVLAGSRPVPSGRIHYRIGAVPAADRPADAA